MTLKFLIARLQPWGMWSTHSLPLLPGPLWHGLVAPDRVLSMGQMEQTVCKEMTGVKLGQLYNNTWNTFTESQKKRPGSFKNVINKMYLQITGHWPRAFTNRPGDQGSIPGRVIPKTLEMVLDAPSLNTQQYKVRIKGKVDQSRERSSAIPYTSL